MKIEIPKEFEDIRSAEAFFESNFGDLIPQSPHFKITFEICDLFSWRFHNPAQARNISLRFWVSAQGLTWADRFDIERGVYKLSALTREKVKMKMELIQEKVLYYIDLRQAERDEAHVRKQLAIKFAQNFLPGEFREIPTPLGSNSRGPRFEVHTPELTVQFNMTLEGGIDSLRIKGEISWDQLTRLLT